MSAPDPAKVYDHAAILFFLVAAERENVMLAGHKATDVLAAAARQLGYSPERIDYIKENAP